MSDCSIQVKLKESKVTLRSYNGDVIKHAGTLVLPVTHQDKTVDMEFFRVKKRHALLGLAASEQFALVQRIADVSAVTSKVQSKSTPLRERVMKDYPELFRSLGCFSKAYRTVHQEGSRSVVQLPRRVPHLLKRPLKE